MWNPRRTFPVLAAAISATLLTVGGFDVVAKGNEQPIADTQTITLASTALTHVHGLAYSADGKQILIPSHHGIAANSSTWMASTYGSAVMRIPPRSVVLI